MKDVNGKIEYKGKEYNLVFNLNVMEKIQERFGTIDKWAELTSGKNEEVNIKALKYGFTEMLNEALEIEADDKGEQFTPITEKQVGRMLTEIGLDKMQETLQSTVVESTKSDEKNA